MYMLSIKHFIHVSYECFIHVSYEYYHSSQDCQTAHIIVNGRVKRGLKEKWARTITKYFFTMD